MVRMTGHPKASQDSESTAPPTKPANTSTQGDLAVKNKCASHLQSVQPNPSTAIAPGILANAAAQSCSNRQLEYLNHTEHGLVCSRR